MAENHFPAAFDEAALSPEERLQACLDSIARQDGAIGALVHLDVAGARQAAEAAGRRLRLGTPRSPVDGMPIVAKANIAVAGWPWTAGAKAYADRVAPRDAACIANLRDAGAVILGLASMYEVALGATSDNPWFGRTYNPHRIGFTAGGSSGGSAAAVAAGFCDAALGTDTIGSVRIPAAYCGIFGYKPRYALIPTDGVVPLSPSLDHVGVLARSANLCRRMTEAAAGVTLSRGQGLGDRTIAALDARGIADMQPAIFEAYAAMLDRARQTGATIIPVRLEEYPLARMQHLLLLIAAAEGSAVHADALRAWPEGFSEGITQMLSWAASKGREKLAEALTEMHHIAIAMRRVLAGVDALILPATPHTAFASDEKAPSDQSRYMTIASCLGVPAMAFPIGMTVDGLPLSAQVLAWDDGGACLDIADALALA